MKNKIIVSLWFAVTGSMIWLFIYILMRDSFLNIKNDNEIFEVVAFGALGSIVSSYIYLTLLNTQDSVIKNGSIVVFAGIVAGIFIKIGFTSGDPQGLVALPVMVLITIGMFGIIIFPLGILSLYILTKLLKI